MKYKKSPFIVEGEKKVVLIVTRFGQNDVWTI